MEFTELDSAKCTRHLGAIAVKVLAGFLLLLSPRAALGSGRAVFAAQDGSQGVNKASVSEDVMEGRCTKMVSPRYPAGAEGAEEVVLRARIDRSGQVHPLFLVSGRPVFENEAMNAVRMWRYRPLLRDDQPIETTTTVRVRFKPGLPAGLVSHPSR